MNKLLIFTFFFIAFGVHSNGQNMPWRKHLRIAQELYEQQEYLDAGKHFELVWRRKTDKLESLYKSGECYLIVKDYLKAAEAFRIVRDRTKEIPEANLKYAICLKQLGKYDLATKELNAFISQNQDEDLAEALAQARKELLGCDLAIKLNKLQEKSSIIIEHLNSNINTPETEFAPIPFSDDILYFSSTMAGKAKIFRSQRKAGNWTKATEPGSFPKMEAEHFCNGSFTPDLSRFYFTQCQSKPSWGGLSSHCEIYMTKRQDNTWSEPVRLRDYINEPGRTSSHPFVLHQGGKEILYFASNREGGLGAMDIWYAERELINDGIDFGFPANAGPDINSAGDEVTPYYDELDGSLYFSSNGHVGMGGFDVFKAQGKKSIWTKAEILPAPLNSNADDYHYRHKPNSRDGFLVSNRLYGMEKISTTHEDIFAFYQPMAQAIVAGEIKEKLSNKQLRDINVKLYELTGNGQKRLMISRKFKDGHFEFGLLPNRSFRVEAKKEGYLTNFFDFQTKDLLSRKEYGQDLILQKASPNLPISGNLDPVYSNKSNSRPELRSPTDQLQEKGRSAAVQSKRAVMASEEPLPSYVSRAKTPGEPFDIVSSAPRHQGVYYKVQLIAVVNYDPEHARYNPVRNLGRMDTEFIPKMKLTRVLLADYFDLKEAESVLEKVIKHRAFITAYIVRYEDGVRIGRWL